MAYTKDQLDTDADRDKANDALRASDIWRDAIRNMGLNPDGPLKLSKRQQQALGDQLGIPADDYHIDPAGNINDFHGWKGLPTPVKIAIVGGATAATLGAAGAFSGGAAGATAAGGAGSAAPLASSSIPVMTAAGVPAAIGGSTAVSAGIPAATSAATSAGGGGGMWGFLKKLIPGASRMLTSGAQADADNRGTEIDATMAANQLNQQAQRDWYNQMVEREQQGIGTRNDAWKAMQQGDYMANWKAPTQKFSPYTRDLEAPSDAMRQAGAARAADANTRFTGNPLPMPEKQGYTLDPKLLEGDIWEKLKGYAGAGLGAWDALRPQVQPRRS